MAASGVEGVKIGAPSGTMCTMCARGALAARYFSRRVEMAFLVLVMLEVASLPLMYLFLNSGISEGLLFVGERECCCEGIVACN